MKYSGGRRASRKPAMKKRALWEVWKDGAVWMVQGPTARIHFNSRKTAREVAARGAALAAKAALEEPKGGAQ